MRIHALSTGTVRLKHSFLFASQGWRRQLDLFLPGPWSEPVPIHCWAVEHEGRLWLIDAGETADAHDIPFARFDIAPAQELPEALAAVDLRVEDVDTVVLTHLHGDHMDGTVHVRAPVLVHDRELAFARTPAARMMQRILRQPLPAGVDLRPLALGSGRFGAFEHSRRLSDDGRIVAISTPGHTPGHISVVCIDDEGRHVLLAGDASDTLEQLRALRADAVSPKPVLMIETMRRILRHAGEHPTVYLPSHDSDSLHRLSRRVTLDQLRPGDGARDG